MPRYLSPRVQESGDFRSKMRAWAANHLGHRLPNGTIVPLKLHLLPKMWAWWCCSARLEDSDVTDAQNAFAFACRL